MKIVRIQQPPILRPGDAIAMSGVSCKGTWPVCLGFLWNLESSFSIILDCRVITQCLEARNFLYMPDLAKLVVMVSKIQVIDSNVRSGM